MATRDKSENLTWRENLTVLFFAFTLRGATLPGESEVRLLGNIPIDLYVLRATRAKYYWT